MPTSDQCCRTIEPFRCWQYRKDDKEPVPRWIAGHLQNLNHDKPSFYGPRSEEYELEEGFWVVEFFSDDDGCEGSYGVYSDEEFRQSYTLESPAAA